MQIKFIQVELNYNIIIVKFLLHDIHTIKKMGMLKLVDRSRLGRGEIIHISSSLITHKIIVYSLNHMFTSEMCL